MGFYRNYGDNIDDALVRWWRSNVDSRLVVVVVVAEGVILKITFTIMSVIVLTVLDIISQEISN